MHHEKSSQPPRSTNSSKRRSPSPTDEKKQARVVELFAGVGGFHLGLRQSGWNVVWANQWEPGSIRVQHAYEVYKRRFPDLARRNAISNEDIAQVANEAEKRIPEHDLLVGGFPCQDYSVAKPLPQANGLGGKKGVLWWEIFRVLRAKTPPLVLLENVDRLLGSPAAHRGRDFAIMLACFASLGYVVEWRVVNAEDYGFPQRRRRVFILARREPPIDSDQQWDRLVVSGVLARALPLEVPAQMPTGSFPLPRHGALPPPHQRETFEKAVRAWVYAVGEWDQLGPTHSPFHNGGVMSNGRVVTTRVRADSSAFLNRTASGRKKPWRLGQVVARTTKVSVDYLVPEEQKATWHTHKGAKSLKRAKGYCYSEGRMSCPDDRSRASRTVITSEGGRTPSRFKHVVAIDDRDRLKTLVLGDGSSRDYREFTESYRDAYRSSREPKVWRRLIPDELEELNGFRRGWTQVTLNGSGRMPDTRRAFLMGNALVVGVVASIGAVLMDDWRG